MNSLIKPKAQLVRASGSLAGGGAFDAAPVTIDVTLATLGILLVSFAQDAGAATAYARLRMLVGSDLQLPLYESTVDDASAPTVVAGVGIATTIDTALKDFPARTGQWAFAVDLSMVRFIQFEFAEVNQGGTPSVLAASILLRLDKP